MSNEALSPTEPAKPSRWLSYGLASVGVLMFLGGAALFVTQLREGLSAPAAPVETDAAHLLERVRAGATWVRVTDAIEPCALPSFATNETSLVYGPVWDASGRFVALTSTRDGRPCHDTPEALTATVDRMSLEAFVDAPEFAAYARPYIGDELVLLTTDLDPRLSISGLGLVGSFASMGLVIAWFYLASARSSEAKRRLPTRDVLPNAPILPKRPLRFARGDRSSLALALAFMSVCTLLFASMTGSMWPEGGTSALTASDIGLMMFCASMTLVFVVLTLVVLRGAFRQTATLELPIEVWAPLRAYEHALAHGVDVGNRQLTYEDPATHEPVTVVIGAHESPAWVVDGHVLLVRDRASGATYVMREDGGPLDLSDEECAALCR